ncbi:MAG: cytochrome b N-terminal domain-containing protein [Candidatus Hydrogenedentota bacterium]
MSARTRITEWVESRTGLVSGIGKFLGEEIPASSGWRNTLGSLAGALLLVQTLTGLLLALYYVPHLEAAHASLEFVNNELLGGSLLRTLHYQGTSFIVIALFIHTVRTFFSGSYRSPREATWITGLILFAIVIALAFSGQLLPYNQMGYWAATVGLEIGAAAPVIGPYIKELLMGGRDAWSVDAYAFLCAAYISAACFAGLVYWTAPFLSSEARATANGSG